MTVPISTVNSASDSRLDRLLSLLATDPSNHLLLADAAEAALSERQPEKAAELLARYETSGTLPPREANLAGLAELHMQRFEQAAERFQRALSGGADDPALRFNLAWAFAMQQEHERALELVDEELARKLPQAAMLQIQLLHSRGSFKEAIERARDYINVHSDYPPLMAAVSVLALDVNDEALAAACAEQGGDHPDALSTRGALALGDNRATEALRLFDQALHGNDRIPRAWVGRGLAKLLTGDAENAAGDIDRGAEMFGDHLGSWIAAGWAYFINKDLVSARARFEKVHDLDPAFAEGHGSLAVLDILDGDLERARERSKVALRLDRQCYSAALAQALLNARMGNDEEARRIYEAAINTPVDGNGRTIAHALTKMGLGRG